MRLLRPASLALIVAAAMFRLASWPAPASADDIFETVYLPTSSVVGLPSATMLPTSYIVPTSFTSSSLMTTSAIYTTGDVLVPTSTSYVVPTYRRVRYRPRRYVERTAYYAPAPSYAVATSAYLTPTSYVVPTRYLATSYVAPTSYLVDSGLVTTSASMSMCCESGSGTSPASATSRTTATRPAPSNGGNTITSTPSSSAQGAERMPSGSVSGPDPADAGIPSRVVPPVPATAGQQTPPPPAPVDAGASTGSKLGDEPGPIPIKIAPPGQTGAGAGGAGAPAGIPKFDQTVYRDAKRPAFSVPPEVRNILRGKVVSFESRRPEESVTVILTSKTGSFVDRTAMTDAFGEFKVSLPTGDWFVKVKMPSGAILPVGQGGYLTASSGRITDPTGLDVPQFTITR